ncbi:Endoplasmic reticulum protein EP58, contains filamin rod domain and KDEL motif [Phaffia rhodozyma]|uniref:Endoplasmic reticulum protein EP58, contains filamin rod domain and KDEL motif n=1 Tax=Phaffia rhodozyma TaxID=264483 RepID=A0A0F7SLF1_PHARH|nr:Endoplasmic reticulum protein EP58, contains filamin rod domain and KDEL motif [Phaffia rhodozyma]
MVPKRRKYLLVVSFVLGWLTLMHRSINTVSSDGLLRPVSETGPSTGGSPQPRRNLDLQFNIDDDPLSVKPYRPLVPNLTGRHPIVNGMLAVDLSLPASQHPIYQLIDSAKKEWDSKLKRQSKTLGEAVREYRRRYGRPPPKGFDKWWDYVQEHDVILPDEYNLIMHDLKPYFAYSPRGLRLLVKEMTSWKDMYTLSVRNGKVHTKSNNIDFEISGAGDRINGQVSHIQDVAQWIPDFDAVLNIHDTPLSFVSDAHKAYMQDLVDDREYLDLNEEADRAFTTWGAACPGSSPLHKYRPRLHADLESLDHNLTLLNAPFTPSTLFTDPMTKSFISSHVHTMNLCLHPDTIRIHASTSGTRPIPQSRLYPIFSLSRTGLHSDVLVIPTEQWKEKLDVEVVRWKDKKLDHLLWRGRNTGAIYSKSTPWRSFQRSRLVALASSDIKEEVAVLSPPSGRSRSTKEDGNPTLEDLVKMLPEGELNDRLMDIGLAYQPVQCSVEDGTCQEIADELMFRPVLTNEEENFSRYILDVDGNAWSARFKRLLSTESLILKSTIYPEFWNDRIQPWLHYVPVKVDYSDLYDIMTFFRGNDDYPGEDLLAQEIAQNGRRWSTDNWRREDMTAYMFRLWLEWARLTSLNRASMDFVYDEE